MKTTINRIFILVLALSCFAGSYSVSRKNREGNELYQKGQYADALKKYSDAMTEAPEESELYFNIGDVLYKQSQFQDAMKLYEKSLSGGKTGPRSEAFYNMGNSKYRAAKGPSDIDSLKDAISLYVKSLEINPGDFDAKYNLEFVQRQLEKQQQQQQQQKEQQKQEKQEKQEKQQEEQKKEEDKEKKEKKEEDQGKKEQEEKEKEKDEQEQKEKQKREQQEKEEEKEQQKPREMQAGPAEAERQEGELTEEQAMRLLQSIEREQRDPANFIKSQINPVPERVDKDW